jgi:glycosyltransferase involved in cell wall biosynthesis
VTLVDALDGVAVETVLKTRQAVAIDPSRHAHVRLHRDWLSTVEFRDLYATSRIVVVTLRGDALNASGVSTVLEAAAMGKPIVVTDADCIRDFIVPGETALTVPPRDPVSLRAAIERLLNDRELRIRLGQNARKLTEEKFAVPVFAKRLARGIRNALR